MRTVRVVFPRERTPNQVKLIEQQAQRTTELRSVPQSLTVTFCHRLSQSIAVPAAFHSALFLTLPNGVNSTLQPTAQGG